jgi:hypothetical protein
MQDRSNTRGRLLVGIFALAMVTGFEIPTARAQDATPLSDTTTPPTAAAEPHRPARTANPSRATNRRKVAVAPKGEPRYFVEFRSRYAASYGHTFLAHGRLNAKGEIAESEVAGLHPATESSVPWMIGHLVPVPSETGPSDGDLEDIYVSARWRVELNQAEYAKIAEFIKDRQANSPLWHAVWYNCNAWVADVAHYMGLRTPASTLIMPADFINGMRELNDGQEPATTASFSSMREHNATQETGPVDSLSSTR